MRYRLSGKIRWDAVRAVMPLALMAVCFAGCGQKMVEAPTDESMPETQAVVIAETMPGDTQVIAGLSQLTMDGPDYEVLKDLPVPETQAPPEYLRIGEKHEIVADLQERLMELGFMDFDEPTENYGEVTRAAVMLFQRQNDLPQDGIVGPDTMAAIMDPEAKYYAVSKGDQGSDIERIQTRLYELGYLASENLVTGNFGDKTEEAVLKLQEINGITRDGKVGQQTINLLYSDIVQPNMLVYGEQSDVVLAAQERLKTLGYMTTTPDGSYGADTTAAVKQFQSRNDLIVDGYLGPSTRMILNSSDAVPNGIGLGDQNESVIRIQRLLSQYGYLSSANITGYFGEVTEKAVKNFQSANGLASDGSVGIQTMTKLTSNNVRRYSGNSSSSSGSSGGSSGRTNSSAGSGNVSTGTASGSAATLISVAKSKLGCSYVWGAKGPNSFDCSGFVYWCLNQVGVKQSYLTSYGWKSVGKYTKITSYSNLRAGDIIVVSGHVGIVAENGTVVDASSGNGRVVHRALSSWWSRNFICGWRIFG